MVMVAVATFASCSGSEKDSLFARFADKPEVISGIGDTITVQVESNTQWQLTKQEGDTWYHVTPASGEGNSTLTIVVDPTTDSQKDRTGKLTITGGTASETLDITQGNLLPPADAGAITGKDTGEAGETITLTVPAIENAEQYQWFRNGVLVATTKEPSYGANLDGSYTVCGVNPMGKGKPSVSKTVKFKRDYSFDTTVQATVVGGGFTYYVLELKKTIDSETEIHAWFKLGEDAPSDLNNIYLPARSYVALEPYQNNYTSKGIVYPATPSTVVTDPFTNDPPQAGRVYITKNGTVLEGSELFFKDSKDNKITVTRNGNHYVISGTLACVQPELITDEYGTSVKDLKDNGSVNLHFDGTISFKNSAYDYGKYYYNAGNVLGQDINITSKSARMLYSKKNPGQWFFEMDEGASYTDPGWSVVDYFYSTNPTEPSGTYVVSKNVKSVDPGTMPRGYYLNNSFGGFYATHYSDVTTRDKLVLGQPNINSYLKIEKLSSTVYRMTLIFYDMEGHRLKMTFKGEPTIGQAREDNGGDY